MARARFDYTQVPTPGQKRYNVTLKWNRKVTGVAQSDVTVEGGRIDEFIDFADIAATTYLWINVDAVLSKLKITLAKDAADQGNDEVSIEWNFGTPVTLTADKTLAEPGDTVSLIAKFASDVTGVAAADFSATDADDSAVTLENFQADAEDASRYTIDAVMPKNGSGTVSVVLAENAATEKNPETSVDIAYSPVSVVLTDDDADDVIDYGGSVKITATFDRPVTGMTADDFSASVGAVSGFTKVSDKIYSVTWTAPTTGSGTAKITLAEDAASEGNPEISVSLQYPFPPATATLTALPTSVNNGASATLTATFDKDVTGIAADDFSADVGTLSDFTKVSKKVYRITYTAPTSGTGTARITLQENAATQRNAAKTVDIAYAPEPPATVRLARGVASVFNGKTTLITATFSKNVSGIALNDFSADDGSVSAFKRISAKVYRITYTAPAAGSGTDTITLRANAATVGNPEATVDVKYAPEPPATVALVAAPPSVNTDGTSTLTATFSKDVTGVALDDFSANDGAVSAFKRISARVYEVTYTAPSSGRGTATVTLRGNAATVGNPEATVDIQYAPIPPAMVKLEAGATFLGNRKTTLITATFSKDVTGVALNDFSASVGRVSGFTKASAKVYRITYTAPAAGGGTARITLRGNAATVGNPEATVDIEYAPIPEVTLTAGPEYVDTYDETLGYNVLPESLGALKRIYPNGAVENLGNLWYDERPHNIAATRLLSIGSDLHLMMGYGPLDEVLKPDSPASQPDNVQHLVYGKTLRYVISDASFTGSIYNALVNLAKLLDATFSIEKNIIHIRQRRVVRSETDSSTGTGTGNIRFKNANKAFPSKGYLRIGDEFIEYTGIRSRAFTGIRRGVLGTTVANHPDSSQIVYLSAVIGRQRITALPKIQSDISRVFNVIQNRSGSVRIQDTQSISKYGEKVYTLNLEKLTDHNLKWQEIIFQRYLENLKDLQYLITLKLKTIGVLKLGDVIGFKYDQLLYVMQSVSIQQTQRSITLKGRTIA